MTGLFPANPGRCNVGASDEVTSRAFQMCDAHSCYSESWGYDSNLKVSKQPAMTCYRQKHSSCRDTLFGQCPAFSELNPDRTADCFHASSCERAHPAENLLLCSGCVKIKRDTKQLQMGQDEPHKCGQMAKRGMSETVTHLTCTHSNKINKTKQVLSATVVTKQQQLSRNTGVQGCFYHMLLHTV